MHEYTECYLYYSMYEQEEDEYIKEIWFEHFEMEVSHLKLALEYLRKNTKKDILDLFNKEEFPELLIFGENKEYIRQVINDTIYNTSYYEDYIDVEDLKDNDRFKFYQDTVNNKDTMVASHMVIEKAISLFGKDYRYEDKNHPIEELRDRKKDNTSVGRI